MDSNKKTDTYVIPAVLVVEVESSDSVPQGRDTMGPSRANSREFTEGWDRIFGQQSQAN